MNLIQRLSFGAVLFAVSTAWAQSPDNPDNTSAQAVQAQQSTAEIPAATPTIAPSEPIEPPSLIPPNSLPGPDLRSLPKVPALPELEKLDALFKQSSLGKQGDEHRLHVQVSELETHIRNDEDLHELKRSMLVAATDFERRHRFKAYYELYYRKLRSQAQDPDLRAYIDAQAAAHELALLQPRVRHETDEAEASRLILARGATPAATPRGRPVQAKVNNVFHP